MDIVTSTWRPIGAYGSSGFALSSIASTSDQCAVHWARLDPGGRIARHPTVGWQTFVMLDGEGQVSGGDGENVVVRAGDVVLWEPGELHETTTDHGLSAVIVETRQPPARRVE